MMKKHSGTRQAKRQKIRPKGGALSKGSVVAVSGGFDPLHIGHIRLLKEAKKLGEKLVVIVNNDHWLLDKKGYVFMNEKERKEIISAFSFVDEVIISSHKRNDTDRSVSKELAALRPDIFANGGDRNEKDAADKNSSLYADIKTCKRYGINIMFNVGRGGKLQSSSQLTSALCTKGITTKRPWGSMTLYAQGENFWLKTISVAAGRRLSLQKHKKRGELWMCIEGEVYAIIGGKKTILRPFETVSFSKGTPHRLGSERGGTIVEIGFGVTEEADNERLEDDYGRT